MRVTGRKCTMPTIRIWQPTPLAARRQCLIHTNPRSAACAISTSQDCHPNFWSNSSSGIGSVSKPASCNNRSCPAYALRFAVWSNLSSGIASNTASGAASRCANSISSGGECAGAIAGAHGWLTYMVKNMPQRRRQPSRNHFAKPRYYSFDPFSKIVHLFVA